MLGKTELVKRTAEKTGLSSSKADQSVNAVLDVIADALSRGEEVRLTGFGTFRVTETKERTGRNPRTGEPITIKAGRRPAFTPGAKLAEAVRGAQK